MNHYFKTKKISLPLFIMISFLFIQSISGQGVTTSLISGTVRSNTEQPLDAVTIIATHTPSGTTYFALTDDKGRYTIANMKPGGPYKIDISLVGYGAQQLESVQLRLGENKKLNFNLIEKITELTTVEVVTKSGSIGENAGTGSQISTENIENMPTINRDLKDFTRLTPQSAALTEGSSFAGTNNRFNSIYIDGAINNDVFGLAASGTNGGQTGISPFSIDIIDQVQVVMSPYDVSLGGFSGAGISAVTKSGTNTVQGTAYYFLQNQNLVGKTNKTYADRYNITERTKVADFTKSTYGFSVGGPIVKDKLFFFVNTELQNDETPLPFDFETYTGNSKLADIESLRNKFINEFNYNPGEFTSTADELDGLKLFGKLDFNVNSKNRLTLRHSFTRAEQFDRFAGSTSSLNFSNNGYFFPSITNSSALEFTSRLGNKFSNSLILGYTKVRDDRDPIGQDFPFIRIFDGRGTIFIGSEEFSTANVLEEDIYTLTDNFKIYKGKHSITIGTHNEFYKMRNVFVSQNFGSYEFDSLSAFINNQNARRYTRSYSLVDDISGDETSAAAEFNAMQLGLYVQDEFIVTDRLSLSAGIRLDVPIITSNPKLDTFLANTAINKIRGYYPVANNVEVGNAPDGQFMFSPRIGFSYNPGVDKNQTLRGGIGVFTSRIPFVWPGAIFNNNGLTIGRVTQNDIPGGAKFIPGVKDQYTNPNFKVPSGQVDLFTKDFKYPQVLRSNLAIDVQLPGKSQLTIEALFTKTLNNIVYTNINSDTTVAQYWTSSGDNRTQYVNKSIVSNYSEIYLASNTSEGSTYSITTSYSKNFNFGLNAFISYTFGDAFAINEGTSSQNSSQWRGQLSVNGRNNPDFGRSDYAIGNRIIANLSYKINWNRAKTIGTTITIFYDGHNNQYYSYVLGGNAGRNPNGETGQTGRNRSLVYVPRDQNDISLVDYKDASNNTISAQQQWDNLNKYIESDSYLKNHRGEYVEKNSNPGVFASFIDLAIRQDLGLRLGGRLHRIQLSFDVFNLANLINSKWGERYSVPGEFNYFYLYQFEKLIADPNNANKVTKPTFTYRGGPESGKASQDISSFSSRWQGRLGVRYIF